MNGEKAFSVLCLVTFFVVKLRDWSRRLSFDTVQQHGRAEGISNPYRRAWVAYGVGGLFSRCLKVKCG